MKITTFVTLVDIFNHLSILLPQEYGPKAVATALQLVVPPPRNEQVFMEFICTATLKHTDAIYNKIARLSSQWGLSESAHSFCYWDIH